MRQNIFMGGGPFGGAGLGQVSDDELDAAYKAYNEQLRKCNGLLRGYSFSCIGTRRVGEAYCDKLKAEMTACNKVAGRLFDAWVNLRKQKSQQTSQQRAQQPGQSNYQWNRAARPTSQPMAVSAETEIHCYFCANLEGAPTYWMTSGQADQWNSSRNAGCQKVPKKECQEKYGQARAQQTARQSTTSTLVSRYANPYGSAMTGIRVENPGLLG
jgi:hypothetical protein